MAELSLEIDPTELKRCAGSIRSLLSEYDARYKSLMGRLDGLQLDETQKKQLADSAEKMRAKFRKLSDYMESGVLDVYETAAKAYADADVS